MFAGRTRKRACALAELCGRVTVNNQSLLESIDIELGCDTRVGHVCHGMGGLSS
jgi:hypothetical protein